MKAYISDFALRMAGGEGPQRFPVVNWTDVCHGKRDFLWIDYDGIRNSSRWVCNPRKRPFVVRGARTFMIYGASETLRGASKIAERLTRELG